MRDSHFQVVDSPSQVVDVISHFLSIFVWICLCAIGNMRIPINFLQHLNPYTKLHLLNLDSQIISNYRENIFLYFCRIGSVQGKKGSYRSIFVLFMKNIRNRTSV